MGAPLSVLRLYDDASGASCFDTYEISRDLRSFAPPAAPVYAPHPQAASGYVPVSLPAGWIGEPHPSPRRQIRFCLSGEIRVTPDVGEPRTISTGDLWMMEDTEGSGHKTEVILERPFEAVIVQLHESAN